jgi:hypothetical protein
LGFDGGAFRRSLILCELCRDLLDEWFCNLFEGGWQFVASNDPSQDNDRKLNRASFTRENQALGVVCALIID